MNIGSLKFVEMLAVDNDQNYSYKLSINCYRTKTGNEIERNFCLFATTLGIFLPVLTLTQESALRFISPLVSEVGSTYRLKIPP